MYIKRCSSGIRILLDRCVPRRSVYSALSQRSFAATMRRILSLMALVVPLTVVRPSEAAPTFLSGTRNYWGITGLDGAAGPGWGGGIGGIYPGVSAYPSVLGPVRLPTYAGSYSSYSPSYPGYVPGLYGHGYLNLRG